LKRSLKWLLFGAALGALFVAERRRPLRRQREPGPERVGRNLTIGLLAAATTAAAEMPIVAPVQRLAERRRLGLLRQFRFQWPVVDAAFLAGAVRWVMLMVVAGGFYWLVFNVLGTGKRRRDARDAA